MTIQQSGKRYKVHLLIAGSMVAVGFAGMLMGIGKPHILAPFGLVLFLGTAYWIAARLVAWWHHG
jgi:uncharacterized membrane protein